MRVGQEKIATFSQEAAVSRQHRDSESAYCNKCYRSTVCLSVTLVHPAKTARWKEMPFGWDTHVLPNNTVLDRGPLTVLQRNA